MLQAFSEHVDGNAPATDGQCFITPAENLTPIRRVAYVITSHDSDRVQAEKLNCLHAIDTHHDIISSLAIPFHDEHGSRTFWDIAQQCADAVNDFDTSQTDQPRFLTHIDFVFQNLTATSVLQTVFTYTIKTPQTVSHQTDVTPPDNLHPATQTQTSEWYEIDCVLERRRQKNGDEFLVKWKDGEQTDWIKRANLSPAAVQEFLQRHPLRQKDVRETN